MKSLLQFSLQYILVVTVPAYKLLSSVSTISVCCVLPCVLSCCLLPLCFYLFLMVFCLVNIYYIHIQNDNFCVLPLQALEFRLCCNKQRIVFSVKTIVYLFINLLYQQSHMQAQGQNATSASEGSQTFRCVTAGSHTSTVAILDNGYVSHVVLCLADAFVTPINNEQHFFPADAQEKLDV